MGTDLKIVIIDHDAAGFNELYTDPESWWDGNEVYKSGIEVRNISYRRRIVQGLLNHYVDEPTCVRGTLDEFVTFLKSKVGKVDESVDKSYVVDEEDLNEVKCDLDDLIKDIEKVTITFDNPYIFTIRN